MPDKEMKATKEIAEAPSIKAMAEHGLLTVISDNGGKDETKTATRTANDDTNAGTEGTGEKSGVEAGGKKPLTRMSKAELAEECQKLGLDVSENDTKETLVEKIRAANVG